MIAFTEHRLFSKATILIALFFGGFLIPSLSFGIDSPYCFQAQGFGNPKYNSLYCDSGSTFNDRILWVSQSGAFLYDHIITGNRFTILYDQLLATDVTNVGGYYRAGSQNITGTYAVIDGSGETAPGGTMTSSTYSNTAGTTNTNLYVMYLVDILLVVLVAGGVVYLLSKKA